MADIDPMALEINYMKISKESEANPVMETTDSTQVSWRKADFFEFITTTCTIFVSTLMYSLSSREIKPVSPYYRR